MFQNALRRNIAVIMLTPKMCKHCWELLTNCTTQHFVLSHWPPSSSLPVFCISALDYLKSLPSSCLQALMGSCHPDNFFHSRNILVKSFTMFIADCSAASGGKISWRLSKNWIFNDKLQPNFCTLASRYANTLASRYANYSNTHITHVHKKG